MTNLKHKIQKLPKADLHNHLHLGGCIKLIKEEYSKSTINIPKYYDGLDGMINYIHNYINKIMLTSEDVIFFMEAAIKSSIADNVTYLEASVDLGLVKFFNNSIEKLIDVVYKLKTTYQSQIDFQPDIGINKDYLLDKVYLDGLACINSGLFNGIDLYGKELNRKLDGYVELFNIAKENKIKTKVHIGEFSDCKSIENAIILLNPEVIQHGIKAINSKKTMDMIINNNIQLNICPQSNLSLGSIKSITKHPVRKLYEHGIKITINTDDLLLFNSTITDQLADLIENELFSYEEIDTIRKNAFK